ncbi:MAG TPA: permease-like cell division protein FtsX [Acidimicrobiia bacterium]|nr:permease-like cell division protein FtsX [Acidimicrobiia bacterium]
MSRVGFLVREALVNLRRNLLVVTGAVLAVFVSLFLAFGALAFSQLVDLNTAKWKEGVHIIAFLNDAGRDGVPADAHQTLLAEVQNWDEVRTAFYIDKTAAYREYQEIFANDPDLLEILENPSVLPASIRIELNDLDLYETVEFRLNQQPALIQKISSAAQEIEQISALSRALHLLAIGLSVVLGVCAVILIANTIRLAIYARRDEVSIMKLVGASNWFIRVPFLLEGLIEGIVGAVLAVFSIWVAARTLAGAAVGFRLFNLEIPGDFFLRWGVVFLFFGAAAGVIGSLLGLSRYLREADGGRPAGARRALEPV